MKTLEFFDQNSKSSRTYSDKRWSLFQWNFSDWPFIFCRDVDVGIVVPVVLWICALSLTVGIIRPVEYSPRSRERRAKSIDVFKLVVRGSINLFDSNETRVKVRFSFKVWFCHVEHMEKWIRSILLATNENLIRGNRGEEKILVDAKRGTFIIDDFCHVLQWRWLFSMGFNEEGEKTSDSNRLRFYITDRWKRKLGKKSTRHPQQILEERESVCVCEEKKKSFL